MPGRLMESAAGGYRKCRGNATIRIPQISAPLVSASTEMRIAEPNVKHSITADPVEHAQVKPCTRGHVAYGCSGVPEAHHDRRPPPPVTRKQAGLPRMAAARQTLAARSSWFVGNGSQLVPTSAYLPRAKPPAVMTQTRWLHVVGPSSV